MPCKNPDAESQAWKNVMQAEVTALPDGDTLKLEMPVSARTLLLDTPGCTLMPGPSTVRIKPVDIDPETLAALLECDNDPESECMDPIIQTVQEWDYFKAFFKGDLHYFEEKGNPVTILSTVLDMAAATL